MEEAAQPLALALLCLAVLAERAGMLALLLQSHLTGSHLYAAWAQAAVLAAAVTALTAAGVRAAVACFRRAKGAARCDSSG